MENEIILKIPRALIDAWYSLESPFGKAVIKTIFQEVKITEQEPEKNEAEVKGG